MRPARLCRVSETTWEPLHNDGFSPSASVEAGRASPCVFRLRGGSGASRPGSCGPSSRWWGGLGSCAPSSGETRSMPPPLDVPSGSRAACFHAGAAAAGSASVHRAGGSSRPCRRLRAEPVPLAIRARSCQLHSAGAGGASVVILLFLLINEVKGFLLCSYNGLF